MKRSFIILIAVIFMCTFTADSEARWYSPQMGRFLSEDPIGFSSGDTNFYRYVWNDPINYIDPSGEGPISVGVCVALSLADAAATGYALSVLQDKIEAQRKEIERLESLCPNSAEEQEKILDEIDATRRAMLRNISNETKARAIGATAGAVIGVYCVLSPYIPY